MVVCEVKLTGGLLKYQKYFGKIRLTVGEWMWGELSVRVFVKLRKGMWGSVLLSLCVFVVFSDKVT